MNPTPPMDSQLDMTLADIMAQLSTLTQIVKAFDQELKKGAPFMTPREVVEESDSTIPLKVTPMIKEFSNVFPVDLSNKRPNAFQHAMN